MISKIKPHLQAPWIKTNKKCTNYFNEKNINVVFLRLGSKDNYSYKEGNLKDKYLKAREERIEQLKEWIKEWEENNK